MIELDTLGRPPGLVGDLYDWINATAGKRQPILALAASLTYVGALGGRLYQGPCGERSNLYCLGVAPSCSGKEHARTQIKKLNHRAGIMNLMGGEDVTSDAAIEMELARQGAKVFYLWDEVGHMFGSIKDAGASGHRKNIIPMLMKLYSSADKTYEGKSYADREKSKARVSIEQPCLSLYGTTVPERLYDALDSKQLLDGFLSRCLLFETTDNPTFDRRRMMVRDIPEELVEQVVAFRDRTVPMLGDGSDGNLIAAQTVNPETIGFTDPAFEMACAFDEIAEIACQEERAKQSGFESLWGRACQNATKIALVVAIGCRSSVIDAPMLEWSINLTTALINDLKEVVSTRVADNAIQKQRNYILQVITEAGKNGATKTDITRKTPTMKARDRNDMLLELCGDFDRVRCIKNEGTRGCTYVLKELFIQRYGKDQEENE